MIGRTVSAWERPNNLDLPHNSSGGGNVPGDRKGDSRGTLHKPSKLGEAASPTRNGDNPLQTNTKKMLRAGQRSEARQQHPHTLPPTRLASVRNMTAKRARSRVRPEEAPPPTTSTPTPNQTAKSAGTGAIVDEELAPTGTQRRPGGPTAKHVGMETAAGGEAVHFGTPGNTKTCPDQRQGEGRAQQQQGEDSQPHPSAYADTARGVGGRMGAADSSTQLSHKGGSRHSRVGNLTKQGKAGKGMDEEPRGFPSKGTPGAVVVG